MVLHLGLILTVVLIADDGFEFSVICFHLTAVRARWSATTLAVVLSVTLWRCGAIAVR